jgi:DNA-binding transcriptional ArsR family regulator
MESLLAITRALSDENRVRALLALGDQEVCICQLIELLQLAPSTVSKHMSTLKHARLVVGRKKGRWMHYRLPAARIVRQVLTWVRQSGSEDSRIRTDAGRMKIILETNRSLICKRQSARRKQKDAEDEVVVAPGRFFIKPARKTASHKPVPLPKIGSKGMSGMSRSLFLKSARSP